MNAGFVEKCEPLGRVERHRRIDALIALLFVDLADTHDLVAGKEECALLAAIFLQHPRRLIAEAVVESAGVDLIGFDDVRISGNDAVESFGHGVRFLRLIEFLGVS